MKERKKYRDELELRTVTRTESNNQAKGAVESESEKSRTDETEGSNWRVSIRGTPVLIMTKVRVRERR